jgi:hypothetical protein
MENPRRFHCTNCRSEFNEHWIQHIGFEQACPCCGAVTTLRDITVGGEPEPGDIVAYFNKQDQVVFLTSNYRGDWAPPANRRYRRFIVKRGEMLRKLEEDECSSEAGWRC